LKIFLIVLAVLGLLIGTILITPVSIIIKTDKGEKIKFLYKIFFKTFAEKQKRKKKTSPILNSIKKTIGISNFDKESIKQRIKTDGLPETLTESFAVIKNLLKRISDNLGYLRVKKLRINIVCAEGDAAATAICYGICCAVVSPLLAYLHSSLRINKRKEEISINCDYDSKDSKFDFEIELSVKVFRIIIAYFRIACDQAKRKSNKS